MSEKNYFAELNSLNQNLVSNAVSNKYDFETLGISKSQRTSFRRKIRKLVLSVYDNVENLNKTELVKFTDFQCNALLIAKNKKFADLKAIDVYPSFDKLPDSEKKKIENAHKQIIAKIK